MGVSQQTAKRRRSSVENGTVSVEKKIDEDDMLEEMNLSTPDVETCGFKDDELPAVRLWSIAIEVGFMCCHGLRVVNGLKYSKSKLWIERIEITCFFIL